MPVYVKQYECPPILWELRAPARSYVIEELEQQIHRTHFSCKKNIKITLSD